MKYDLELKKAVEEIRKNEAKKVLIQLPDGLKPEAREIKMQLEKETNCEVYIWLGSCFGGCDFPRNIKTDLMIAWGHSEWRY